MGTFASFGFDASRLTAFSIHAPMRLGKRDGVRATRLLARLCGAGVVVVGLAGCADVPSDSDLEKAITAELSEAQAITVTMMGADVAQSMPTTLHSIKTFGCDEAQDEQGLFVCDVEADITSSPEGRQKRRAKMRMRKQGGDWLLIKQL